MASSHLFAILIAGIVSVSATTSDAQTAMPLSEILRMVETDGNRTIANAETSLRSWEVVSCEGRSRICREDVIDPNTGAVRKSGTEGVWSLPPTGAMPASDVVALVEAMNIGNITELDFDDGEWEVEVRAGIGSRAELKLDPMTGARKNCEGRACP